MLIVALQDGIDNLYAIWNTVTDRFLGVNLEKEETIKIIMEYKKCSYDDAKSRTDNPQPFSDLAKAVDVYDEDESIAFLNSEIAISEKRLKEYSVSFDGVRVGDKERKELLKSHIDFCNKIKNILVYD